MAENESVAGGNVEGHVANGIGGQGPGGPSPPTSDEAPFDVPGSPTLRMTWERFRECVKASAEELDIREGEYVCNFDPTAVEGKRLLRVAADMSDVTAMTKPSVWQVKWWVVYGVKVPARGKLPERIALKTVLVNPRGLTFGSFSRGICRSCYMLAAILGDAKPYDPPVTVQFDYSQRVGAGTLYTFKMVTGAEALGTVQE